MIDLHSHILPGLDDGAEDMAESLRMLRIASEDGIEVMVATPHVREGVFENTKSVIVAAQDKLKEEARQDGIDLEILAGADIHISADLLEKVERDELLTINDKRRHMLVELPAETIPPGVGRILFELRLRQITPIITHPERMPCFHRSPDLLEGFVNSGCLVQITAGSLTGRFGSQVRKFTRDLVRTRLAHIIASDCHSSQDRPPRLADAVEEASRLVGETEALKMVEDHPRSIILGEEIDPAEPLKRPSFFRRLFR